MLIHGLRRDVLTADARMTDDLTMLMISRHDPQRKLFLQDMPIDLGSLEALRQFIDQHAQAAGLAEEAASLLTVAAVEVLTNVVRHATGLVQGAPVTVLAEQVRGAFVVELHYLGDQYDPPADPPDTDFSTFPEGGFGLSIIHGATDDVEFIHSNGVNTVRLTCLVSDRGIDPIQTVPVPINW